ncbi:MAG: hypothetical protein JW849_11420 [Phycisphaerae bacterium]|nr:hypothetical protein [Phycisphaerae bacterium]
MTARQTVAAGHPQEYPAATHQKERLAFHCFVIVSRIKFRIGQANRTGSFDMKL